MTRLEGRYRSLLRLLPRWYRDAHGEELVAAFLAGRPGGLADVDGEYGWLGWSATTEVLRLAVRTRLPAPGGGPPRAVAVGEAVRLVALLGLLTFAALGVANTVSYLASTNEQLVSTEANGWIYLFLTSQLAAVAAFAGVLARRRAAARAFAVISTAYGVLHLAVYAPETTQAWLTALAAQVPLWAVVACVFAGFHQAAPRPAARSWLRGAAVGTVAALCWSWPDITQRYPTGWTLRYLFADPTTLPTMAIVLAAAGYLAVVRPRGQDGSAGAWPLALAVAAGLLLPVRLDWAYHLPTAGDTAHIPVSMVATALGQFAAVLVAGAVLAVVASRDYRRLPAADEWQPCG